MLKNLEEQLAGYSDFLVKIRGRSPKSARSYLRHVENFARYLHSMGEEVESASRQDIESWLKHEFMRGMKPGSRAAMLTGVKGFYLFLVREGVMSGSPASQVPGPKLPKHSAQKFTTEELRMIFAGPDVSTIPGIRDMALLTFMYGAGPRADEICRLSMGDLSFTAQTCTVLLHGKGAKERTVKLLAAPALAMKAWYDVRVSMSSGAGITPDDPVFISLAAHSSEDMRLSNKAVNAVLKKYTGMIGMSDPEAFVHKMRSTFATDLYDLTKDIMLVAAKMGHTTIETTQRYIVISETALHAGVITNQRWNQLRGGALGIQRG